MTTTETLQIRLYYHGLHFWTDIFASFSNVVTVTFSFSTSPGVTLLIWVSLHQKGHIYSIISYISKIIVVIPITVTIIFMLLQPLFLLLLFLLWLLLLSLSLLLSLLFL